MTLSHQCPPHPWQVPSCRYLEHDDGVTVNDPGRFNHWINQSIGQGKIPFLCPSGTNTTKGYLFDQALGVHGDGDHGAVLLGAGSQFSRLLFQGQLGGAACLGLTNQPHLSVGGLEIRQRSGRAGNMLLVAGGPQNGWACNRVELSDVVLTTSPATSNGTPAADNGGITAGVQSAVLSLHHVQNSQIRRLYLTDYTNYTNSAAIELRAVDDLLIDASEIHSFVMASDTIRIREGSGHIAVMRGLISSSAPKRYSPQTGQWDSNYPQGRAHIAVYGDAGPLVIDGTKLYSESGNAPQSVVWQESGRISGWDLRLPLVQATFAVFHGVGGTIIDRMSYRASAYYAKPPYAIYKAGNVPHPTLIDSTIWRDGMTVTPGGSHGGSVLVY